MATAVTIVGGLDDNDTNDMPYELSVEYVADEDGLEVAIEYAGFAVTPKDAPQPSGLLTFTLNWGGTTTAETVRAVLRVKANPTERLQTDSKYGLTFIGGPP